MAPACGLSSAPSHAEPGEIVKITLAIFFAGYLVANRDKLAIAWPEDFRFAASSWPRPGANYCRLAHWYCHPRFPARPGNLATLLRPVRCHAVCGNQPRLVADHWCCSVYARLFLPSRRSRMLACDSTFGSTLWIRKSTAPKLVAPSSLCRGFLVRPPVV